MALAVKEEEEKEKKRRQEEKKKTEQQSKEEVNQKADVKKEEIKGEMKGMAFGEAKPIVEVGYIKKHIEGTLASEKYEPVVKESLVVKLIEEEKKKELEREKEKITDEIQKSNEKIKKEEEEIRKVREEAKKKIEKEKLKEKEKREKIDKEKIQQRIKKQKELIKNLLDQAQKKGMLEPVRDIAKELLKRELRRGIPPRMALKTVMAILSRLDLVKTKKKKKSILSFLKSLLNNS